MKACLRSLSRVALATALVAGVGRHGRLGAGRVEGAGRREGHEESR